ncbi:hypothetical protein, partial [Paramuribaculum intestinale]|uniref:hypothetical protein n=1 Tax=Paramuribaculum intestinale TaxID=2094151 RepID=UPI0025B01923
SSTKIRMRHDSHPTKPPYGRHGGAYKGRWSTTTPPLTAEWREAIVKAGRDGAAERAGSQ